MLRNEGLLRVRPQPGSAADFRGNGQGLFAFDALTCEALVNFDLSVSTADYLQPFPSVVIELPADYTRKRVVPFEECINAPDFVIVRQ